MRRLLTVIVSLLFAGAAHAAPPLSVVPAEPPPLSVVAVTNAAAAPACACADCTCGPECRCAGGACACPDCGTREAVAGTAPAGPRLTAGSTWDALNKLNAQRAARGLDPYIWDEALTQAAAEASKARAAERRFGHTNNDFAFLPRGASADAAGCAAYPYDHGVMACAMYEPGLHKAGCAMTVGPDGKCYWHLFIRRAGGGPAAVYQQMPRGPTAFAPGGGCASGRCPSGR